MRAARFLLYPTMLGLDTLVWLLACVLRLAVAESWSWRNGSLVVVVPRASWLGRLYKNTGAATLGHMIVIFSGESDVTLDHEYVHVRQLEMGSLAGFLCGLFAAWPHPVQGLLVWFCTPIMVYLCGGLVALCYGGNAYRDNPNEAAAYDHTAAEKKS